ncbi:MAG TPA: DNA-directed RNA polymerase subunit alpha C-terminal domain-containing protein [Phycisphaerales bacterium]|nr:DNA-directed RNA polymerase subunit alpha C-terminal domain-containing protein [Phycisphaerales bacterium]
MSSNSALDMVIGAGEAQRNAKQAAEHARKGDEAYQRADKAGAVSEYRRAAAADPNNSHIFFRLGYLLDLVGEEDEAIAMYERACENPPAPINALINLAVLLEDRGDYHRAERTLKQILETNPNHPRARLYMKDIGASKDMHVEDDGDKDRLKRNALLDVPVTDFELSVRARTCLKKMNIRTLGDLLRTTEAELLAYKNFGDSSLVEIKQMLASKGLRLGQGVEDAHRAARRRLLDQLKGSGNEAALAKPVTDLSLSVRARKALQLLNIQSLGDLVAHTEAELMGVKNFGATSLQEVKDKLTEYGLALRELEA